MEQGDFAHSTVVPAVQVKTRTSDEAAALNVAAKKLLTTTASASSVAEAIERHRTALHALNTACNAADVVAIRLAGGDTSSKALAPLVARREAACKAEIRAFEALLTCQPTDATALADMLDYVANSPAFDDLDSGSEALRHIAQGARRLAIYPARAILTEAVPQDGTILFEDAGGKAYREPISHWIAFMAQRIFSIARSESGRQFRAHCAGLDQDGSLALDNHIRRTLRLDALHDLAFRSDAVFEAGKEYALGRGPVMVHANDDADILALGRQFDDAHASLRALYAAHKEAHASVAAFRAEHTNKLDWTTESIHDAAWAQPGVGEAEDAYEKAYAHLDQIIEHIIAASAGTVAGVAVKARAHIPVTWFGQKYEEDAKLGSHEDWDRRTTRSLIDACLSLAGVDWKGEATGAASPSPAVSATPPMVDELLDAWAEWTKTDGTGSDDEEWEKNADLRDNLIDRVAALPATRENAPAKAIAQSWLEYVSLWRRDKPRGSYGIDGQLCFDIHDAALATVGGAA